MQRRRGRQKIKQVTTSHSYMLNLTYVKTFCVMVNRLKLTIFFVFQIQREECGPDFANLNIDVSLLPSLFSSPKFTMVSRFNDVWGCLSALPDKTESSIECSRSKTSVSSNHREIGPYRSPLVYFRSYRYVT